MPHTLFIVSTPIGNLEDITFRAVRTLKEVSLILAEDTRHSRILLNHFGIQTKTESYHDFNKEQATPKYIEYLKNIGDIALICDAGTPGIADPAFNLVRAAKQEQIPVRAIPGANAMLAALVASGFATDRFRFESFSPKKSAQRLHLLQRLKEECNSTLIFYASPHNLVKFLGEIREVYGETKVALMRELTKKFEEHLIGTPSELLERYKNSEPKGEFVLLINKADIMLVSGKQP
ncbi:MAG: 16S rRNA (cytidine(1402)-2'-O)-methyltransferase [Fibromonadaceae bacterium]|jgi:16S rRNA (cytidine1402-2'-O)-methyltransferase|nr:16S rRNA (cytidine(1402)-2'-O)-methyltransferase [Fibromonadaceae bacterium]